MTTAIDPTSDHGYGWRMSDSDRLNERLDTASRRRSPQPARVGPVAKQAIEALALKHVTDPRNFRPATDEQMQAKEDEIKRERLQRKAEIMLSRLPERYRDVDFIAGPAGRAAAQWCREYWEGSRASLVILGPVGTGKTWLAAAIVKQLMVNIQQQPVPCTFITVADLMASLRGPFRPGLDVDMQQFMLAPVLVLDDLGQEMQTEWTREQLYRLAHARYHEGRPTIVTSNLTGDEIKTQYESRTVQRLFGGARLIELTGESRRQLPF